MLSFSNYFRPFLLRSLSHKSKCHKDQSPMSSFNLADLFSPRIWSSSCFTFSMGMRNWNARVSTWMRSAFVLYVIQLKDQSHIKHLDVGNGKCWHTLQTWNIIELNWFSSEKDRKQVEKESRHLPWDEAGQRETIFSRKISNDLSLFATIRILLNAMSLDQVIQ